MVCAFDSQRQADLPNHAVEMQGDPVSKKTYNYFKLIQRIYNVSMDICHQEREEIL